MRWPALARELVARDQGIGELILRAYLIRRSILIGLGAGLRIIGSRYSPDTRRLRDFCGPEPASVPVARSGRAIPRPRSCCAQSRRGAARTRPIVILRATGCCAIPSNAELAARGRATGPAARPAARCDLLVVGGRSGRSGGGGRVRRLGGTFGACCWTGSVGGAGRDRPDRELLGFPAGLAGGGPGEPGAYLQALKFGAELVAPVRGPPR